VLLCISEEASPTVQANNLLRRGEIACGVAKLTMSFRCAGEHRCTAQFGDCRTVGYPPEEAFREACLIQLRATCPTRHQARQPLKRCGVGVRRAMSAQFCRQNGNRTVNHGLNALTKTGCAKQATAC
jgi:hypothetical protein